MFALSQRVPNHLARRYSSTTAIPFSQQTAGKLYELRTYNVRPDVSFSSA
jgi:hypothetical protein